MAKTIEEGRIRMNDANSQLSQLYLQNKFIVA
jgi:hypothetical protein